MSGIGLLIVLYVLAMVILVAEIFIPSHGLLSVVGVGLLVWAVWQTFAYGGREAGIVAILACLVVLPTFAGLAIKYWHRTPVGRRIAPPNPVLTAADTSVPVVELSGMIGQTGRCVSPLRPVGVCDFGGRRVSCLAEYGLIESGATVVGTRITGGNLAVVEKKA